GQALFTEPDRVGGAHLRPGVPRDIGSDVSRLDGPDERQAAGPADDQRNLPRALRPGRAELDRDGVSPAISWPGGGLEYPRLRVRYGRDRTRGAERASQSRGGRREDRGRLGGIRPFPRPKALDLADRAPPGHPL